jgi:hypothetical protein
MAVKESSGRTNTQGTETRTKAMSTLLAEVSRGMRAEVKRTVIRITALITTIASKAGQKGVAVARSPC